MRSDERDEATECLGDAGDLGGVELGGGGVCGVGGLSGAGVCGDSGYVFDFVAGDAGVCGARCGGRTRGEIWSGGGIFAGRNGVCDVCDLPGGDGNVRGRAGGSNGGVCVCAAGAGGFLARSGGGKRARFFDRGGGVDVREIRADALDVAVPGRAASLCVYGADGGECGAGVFSAGEAGEGRGVFDGLGKELGNVCAGEFCVVRVCGDSAGDTAAFYCV